MRIPLQTVSAAMCLDAYLRAHDIIDADWPGVIGNTPADPTTIIILKDTGGRQKGRLMRNGEPVYAHSIKVIVRSRGYAAGFAKCKQIETAFLLGIRNVELLVEDAGGTNILVDLEAFKLTTPTTPLGNEETNDALLFVLNGYLTAREIH